MPYAELLNGIDEIAEKLTTGEYQKLMNLLQESQEQEPQQEEEYYKLVYEKITIVAYSYFDDDNTDLISETKEIVEVDNIVYGKIIDSGEPLSFVKKIHTAITQGKMTSEDLQILQANGLNKIVISKDTEHTIIYRIKSLLKM